MQNLLFHEAEHAKAYIFGCIKIKFVSKQLPRPCPWSPLHAAIHLNTSSNTLYHMLIVLSFLFYSKTKQKIQYGKTTVHR